MNSEEQFLAAILTNPSDMTQIMAYSGWLESQGQFEKARLLNLLYHPGTDYDPEKQRKIQEIAAGLNTNWLAVVTNPKVINCGRHDSEYERRIAEWWHICGHGDKTKSYVHPEGTWQEWLAKQTRMRFDFVCNKKWNQMTPTDDVNVRHCGDCQENIYFTDTILDARKIGHEGHCVAIDLGVIRREDDMIEELAIFGRPSKEHVEEERQRRLPDPVSSARINARYPVLLCEIGIYKHSQDEKRGLMSYRMPLEEGYCVYLHEEDAMNASPMKVRLLDEVPNFDVVRIRLQPLYRDVDYSALAVGKSFEIRQSPIYNSSWLIGFGRVLQEAE